MAPDGRQVGYKEQNTQTVDKNIDNKVLPEAERQLRVINWERKKRTQWTYHSGSR